MYANEMLIIIMF